MEISTEVSQKAKQRAGNIKAHGMRHEDPSLIPRNNVKKTKTKTMHSSNVCNPSAG